MKKSVILISIIILLSGCSSADKIKQEPAVEKEIQQTEEIANTAEAEKTIEPTVATSSENDLPPTEKVAADKAYLIINFGGNSKQEAEIDLLAGATAFSLLQAGAEQLGLSLETEEYAMGIFVKAIDAAEGGMDGKYWTYYVNDEFANVAADQYKIKAGDRVEWRFGKSPF